MSNEDNASETLGFLTEFSVDLPPAQRVLALFMAKWTIGALRPLVQLNVPDLLAEGPRTVADLAEATGTNVDALYRVLRCTSAAGIFAERVDGTFALTPVGEGLRSNVAGSARDMFLFASDPMMWRPYEDVLHTVRTGEPSFDHVFGTTFFDYLRANPASGVLFDHAMIQNHYPATDRILAQYDFGRFRQIADVGGGKGQFLADVLTRFPECTGVLCDQPQVVASAKEVFEASRVADRVTIVETDFFVEIPAGSDAYFIKHALHNWNDEKAEIIVRRIREAIGTNAEARLLIVDMLLTGPGQWDIGKLTDIEMLVALGGRERSIEEWNRVLAKADFELANDPTPGDLALLEYRPV